MAKHCNVCDRDYADNLTACPHCAAAKKTQLVTRGDERATRLVGPQEEKVGEEAKPSDSAVNLGGSPVELVEGDAVVVLGEVASNVNLGNLVGDANPDLSQEVVVEATGDGPAIDDEGASTVDTTPYVAKPDQPSASASDIALESLLSDAPSAEPPAEEQAVSEGEEDDPLADLEEAPAESAASGVKEQEAVESIEDEEVIDAAAAEEAAAVADAEEEAKPTKDAKPRSNVLALAGATLLGILIGTGGTIGARAVLGSGDKGKSSPLPSLPSVAKAAPTFETLAARVASGDWDEAKTGGIEQIQGADAKELAARGEYYLGNYLKNAGGKINPQDPALSQALQDLQKAAEQKEPNAVYDLAHIKELAGQLTEARAEYAKAAQAFADDPVQKQRFESAILRVELKAADKAAGAAKLPQREGLEERAVLLTLLSTALLQPPVQAPQQPGQPPQQLGQRGQQPAAAETKEAGFNFWDAANLAQKGKFDEAIRALDQARKLHDQLRFTRLRKAQNPLSDPAEDIFLRCCDELKVYWQMKKSLREGGYLTGKNTPAQALQTLVQQAKGSDTKMKGLTDKLTAAQKSQKNAEDKAAGLETKVRTSTAENTKLAGDLKAAKKTIEEHQADFTSAKEQNAKLKSDKDNLNATLTKIRAELKDANLLGPQGNGNVGEAVKKAIEVAKSRDPQGTLRRQRDEIAQLSASLKERWQPGEMLSLWLLLLDENRNRSELAGQAMRDAKRVLMDPRATAAQKGEAQVVLGLALRNVEKFSEAKAMLEAARGVVDKGEWLAHTDAALIEVSNPAAYFTAQAQAWYDRGRIETALAVLARGMKVVPAKEQGKLLAQRSLIELDAARSKIKGTLPPTEPLLITARRDADAAIKAGAAEGHYAAGRIAEEIGQIDAAITSYRAALAAHGGKLDAAGGRYRMALARVLLLPREARPNQPAAKSVGWVERSETHHALQKNLILLLTLSLQAPLLPGDEPGQEEAEKLADEVLKAPPGTVHFTVLAQALAVKGHWNRALQVYVEGIRPLLPREYGNGLVYLLLHDPRLKRPDSLRTPNPLEAEKHFAAGLNFYFDRDFVNAEKELLLTIENDSQDARFFYFLGLSRLEQNRRRDAYADFSQGALLERLNRPSSAAVSESLERIQGPTRLLVNEFREDPER